MLSLVYSESRIFLVILFRYADEILLSVNMLGVLFVISRLSVITLTGVVMIVMVTTFLFRFKKL
jgi:hypothetical protein